MVFTMRSLTLVDVLIIQTLISVTSVIENHLLSLLIFLVTVPVGAMVSLWLERKFDDG